MLCETVDWRQILPHKYLLFLLKAKEKRERVLILHNMRLHFNEKRSYEKRREGKWIKYRTETKTSTTTSKCRRTNRDSFSASEELFFVESSSSYFTYIYKSSQIYKGYNVFVELWDVLDFFR